jgi:phosphoenolpyruvate-protein kinase (PTS system EI component)
MDETVTVDVETGKAVRAPMTPADKQRRQRVVEAGERAEREQIAEEASRDAVIEKIAVAAGVSAADIKRAFRVGSRGRPGPG